MADAVYFKFVQEIIDTGAWRDNRTAERALSAFVPDNMKFDLTQGFPLLKSKKMYFASVVDELLWFLRGSTDATELTSKIWAANSSREFLDSRGLTSNPVGDLGPVYGFQWRHFGAVYKGAHADYTHQGVDQIRELVRKLKETPESRQIVMSAWNPVDLPLMALPPCHFSTVFRVEEGRYLCAHVTQRSGDAGLGVPFNLASYALLMHILGKETGLIPRTLVLTCSDAHIYESHLAALKKQLTRTVDGDVSPTIRIDVPVGTPVEAVRKEHVVLENYFPITDPLRPFMRMVP